MRKDASHRSVPRTSSGRARRTRTSRASSAWPTCTTAGSSGPRPRRFDPLATVAATVSSSRRPGTERPSNRGQAGRRARARVGGQRPRAPWARRSGRRRDRPGGHRTPRVIRRRVIVHGFVQGVFFRDTLRRRAIQLGVSGWARNNHDGTVEAVFEGEPAAVERMVELSGQPAAHASSGWMSRTRHRRDGTVSRSSDKD